MEWVVIALAAAEAVSEVLVVLVIHVGLLGVHSTLGIRLGVDAQVARARFGVSRGTAVAGKVPLGEDLDECVLSVTLDRAGIADTGGIVRVGGVRGRRIAGQTGEDALTQGTERFRAMFDALEGLLAAKGFRCVVGVSHIWQGFTRISLELHLIADEARN